MEIYELKDTLDMLNNTITKINNDCELTNTSIVTVDIILEKCDIQHIKKFILEYDDLKNGKHDKLIIELTEYITEIDDKLKLAYYLHNQNFFKECDILNMYENCLERLLLYYEKPLKQIETMLKV